MESVQDSLVLVGVNTSTPKAFWNGIEILGVIGIGVDWENDEHRVKLRVRGSNNALYSELTTAGISVKKVNL